MTTSTNIFVYSLVLIYILFSNVFLFFPSTYLPRESRQNQASVSSPLLLFWPYESLLGFLLLTVLNQSYLPLSLRSDIHFTLSISLLSQPFYLLHLLSSYSVSHTQCFFALSSHVTPLFHTQPHTSKLSFFFPCTSQPSPKNHCKYIYFHKRAI